MTDYTTLYREDATESEQIATYQAMVNSGQAWKMEGHVGRTAMDMIKGGVILLGREGHRDYYGNYVPSRTEVKAGTKGSAGFVEDRQGREHREAMEAI